MLRKPSGLTRLLLLALLLASACTGGSSTPDTTEPPDTDGPALDEPVSCDAAATEYADLAALGVVDCYEIGDGEIALTLLTVSEGERVRYATLGLLRDQVTGNTVGLTHSPLFSVVLYDGAGEEHVELSPSEHGYLDLQAATLAISGSTSRLRLEMAGLPVGGGDEVIDAALVFEVRDGMVRFDMEVEQTAGSGFVLIRGNVAQGRYYVNLRVLG